MAGLHLQGGSLTIGVIAAVVLASADCYLRFPGCLSFIFFFEYWIWIVWFVIILLIILFFLVRAASRPKTNYPDYPPVTLYTGEPTIPQTAAKLKKEKQHNADYKNWSYQKLRRWKSAQENKMAMGDFRQRPNDIKLWTPEEINDWKIEEWLNLLEIRRNAK